MAKIQVYTTRWCAYCVRAKGLLQIVVGGKPIGGYAELWRLDREGRLEDRPAAA
jgi:glutaredoxin